MTERAIQRVRDVKQQIVTIRAAFKSQAIYENDLDPLEAAVDAILAARDSKP